MPEPGLAEKLVRLHEALSVAKIPHAFGGALALAYYAQPRATIDIDVNLFVPPEDYGKVLEVLEPLGISKAPSERIVQRDGQARVWWGRTPLDLFFANDPIHEAMRARVRVVPFGDTRIPVLAPEYLLVAKVVFDRTKDWADIEEMFLANPSLDLSEAERWLDRLLTADDQRVIHLRAVVADVLGT